MTSLVSLVTRIEQQLPSLDGIPTSTQMVEAVMAAVTDFSRRAGRGAVTDVTLQDRVATYPLPNDFLKFIRVESAGEYPMVATSFPNHLIDPSSRTMTLHPVPGTLASATTPGTTWRVHYLASYVLEDGVFVGLGDTEASIVLLKALSYAIGYQIRQQGTNDVTGYNQGNLSVQRKSSPAEALRRQQAMLDAEYREDIRVYLGVR